MATVDGRTVAWVDLAVELLKSPSSQFPLATVGEALIATFECDVAALNWRRASGVVEVYHVERSGAAHGGLGSDDAATLMAAATNSDLLNHHPLFRWIKATGRLLPQSLGSVPATISSGSRHHEVLELLRTVGVEQELMLPLAFGAGTYLVFTLSRSGADDFPPEQLVLASRIQPLLIALHRQARVLEMAGTSGAVSSSLLTGRERAVLELLAEGMTADAIGSTLGCSGRTVEKHLENAYRKLGVTDKVSALRIAQEEREISPVIPRPWSSSGPSRLAGL